jgi:hypothetical protein
MADFGAPVAGNVAYNPTQGLNTLSALYNIEQSKAVAQQQMQTAKQRAGFAKWVDNTDLSKFAGPDGTLDMDKVYADKALRQATGDNYPQAITTLVGVRGQQLQNKQALVNLNSSTLQNYLTTLSGLRTDPDVVKGDQAGLDKALNVMKAFGASSPDAARIVQLYGGPLQNTPAKRLVGVLSNYQQQAEAAQAQQAAQAPQLVNKGGSLTNVAPQSAGGPLTGVQNIPTTIPPGYSITHDATGAMIAVNNQNPGQAFIVGSDGSLTPMHPPPANAPAQTPGEPVIPQTVQTNKGGYVPPNITGIGSVQNQEAQAKTDQLVYSSDVNNGLDVPQTKYILNQMSNLSKEVPTGPGSEWIANAETVLGQYAPGMSGALTDAAKRNMLGKYFYQLANQYATANFGTDQGKFQVQKSLPNPDDMSPQGLREAAKFVASQMQISQARNAFATEYQDTHKNSVGYQQAVGELMQKLDPRVFDFIQTPAGQRKKWLDDNIGKVHQQAFIDNMKWVLDHGGFNYQ